ncbi:phage protein NinX family protein [Burkholderia ambifaria]|uniref:phage protein NinX family protein n=1 Tax=Burkholderia ambifaria TaxID=152480 RepID=UPI00158C47CA|nr:phage protein NinX family protein [Burkholderia ambifaria]
MKVSELTGSMLDYWVARAEGADDERATRDAMNYRPSSIWSQGGPIIDREDIATWKGIGDIIKEVPVLTWFANAPGMEGYNAKSLFIDVSDGMRGPTPLVAAMRAFVFMKFGEEVPSE